jgi:hypothetical protein
MKSLIVTLLIFQTCIVCSQESKNVTDLYARRTQLETSIQELKDSLKLVNTKISEIEHANILVQSRENGIVAVFKEGAKLKLHPNPIEDPIFIFKREKEVKIIDYSDGFFGVVFDTLSGYINEVWVKNDERVKKYVIAKVESEAQKLKLANETSNAIRREKIIARYGVSIYSRVERGEYWIGMTDDLAILSLGFPKTKNRTVGGWGVHEQWVYEKGNRLYLYFENGILTSYQD